jgi:hypothetical protein
MFLIQVYVAPLDLVDLRAEWLMDRITFYRPSDRVADGATPHQDQAKAS